MDIFWGDHYAATTAGIVGQKQSLMNGKQVDRVKGDLCRGRLGHGYQRWAAKPICPPRSPTGTGLKNTPKMLVLICPSLFLLFSGTTVLRMEVARLQN